MKKVGKPGKLIQAWGVVFCLVLLIQTGALAQSSSVQIKALEVELWPEYDRPQTLVIYHLELAPTVALPAEVTFRLPGYLEQMYVVAVERDGVLVEVSPDTINLRSEGSERLLTFSTPVPKIQFEYYDEAILTKAGAERRLNFDFVASYPIEKATFKVQEPFLAENFKMTPTPGSTFTGNDGLKYNTVEMAGLAAAETVTITASYSRSSDDLSAQNLPGVSADHAADLAVVTEPPPNQNLTLGYSLIGIGVVLLLGVGGYWWWSKRMISARAKPTPRPSKRAVKPAQVTAPAASPPGGSASNFCYRCGAALREDANFCHICGTERRRE